jgi:hypothetical protein
MDRMKESEILEAGLALLRRELGDGWVVAPQRAAASGPTTQDLRGVSEYHPDALITVTSPDGQSSPPILVEIKLSARPAQIAELAVRVELIRRITGDAAVLIIAPWLSPRTRESLDERGYGYLDLTGNISWRLNRPGLIIRLLGNQQDPNPRNAQGRTLAGDRAGRLIRALIDFPPPYRAISLVRTTGLSESYVSRLLTHMEQGGLIDRSRGEISNVDWQGLILARSTTYELLKAHEVHRYVASEGADDFINRRRHKFGEIGGEGDLLAVTGTYAAQAYAPIAVGGQLMMYAFSPHASTVDWAVRRMKLLPAVGDKANVLMLRPRSDTPLLGRFVRNGVPYVALSQLALDSLGGTGRMPAEGEALRQWMANHESDWHSKPPENWAHPGSLG